MKKNLLGVLCNAGKPQQQRQTTPLADRVLAGTAPAERVPVVLQVPSTAQQWDHRKGKKILQLINVVRYKNSRILTSLEGDHAPATAAELIQHAEEEKISCSSI